MRSSDPLRFFDAVVGYEIALWSAVEAELAGAGQVSLGQLHALRVLAHHEGRARVQEVSADIGITVGAASKLVDRLERDGLAVRRANPANRRSSLVSLTPAGERAVSSGADVARAAVDRAVGGEDVEVAAALLERLGTRLHADPARSAA